eukprot:scaffold53190_cov17-Tisochrysis_lutea.AAC.1
MDKQTYKKASVLEPYFTGGAARVTRDGKLLACVCGEEVKVSASLSACGLMCVKHTGSLPQHAD